MFATGKLSEKGSSSALRGLRAAKTEKAAS